LLRKSELKGMQGPGLAHRTVVTLFADDTTVYLNSDDDFQTLQSILDKWCIASGAKFNTTKTEVIPIGSKLYRENLQTTRLLSPNHPPIPESINIASDGVATRILGAWIGNETNEEGVWSTALEKIAASLERWESTNPTVEGRKIILQFTVAGISQYLTVVQGMPSEIENRILKISHSFIWDNAGKSTINKETLHAPVENG
ncbi:hypothetical protein PLICRDRAFT_68591, partial [Plicaturopsis crispa FD-325 SS-3]